MKLALGVEYDGSSFTGWQSQPRGNTVQDVLEKALSAVADRPVATVCAGRTDTGVHALMQVVHFETDVHRPTSAWVRGTNANLPRQVVVVWAQPVTDDFHARFSATARSYRYVLLNHPVRPGVQHHRVGWYHAPLDVESMRKAAGLLLGEHDFSSFRSSECQAKSPVRVLRRLDVFREGDYLLFELEANAFLHHMVRNIVGALIFVGSGRRPVAWLAEILAARDRTRGAPTFEAAGLYLTSVSYEPRWCLPIASRIMRPSPSLPL